MTCNSIYSVANYGSLQLSTISKKRIVVGQKSLSFGTKAPKDYADTLISSAIDTWLEKPYHVQIGTDDINSRHNQQATKALKDYTDTLISSAVNAWLQKPYYTQIGTDDFKSSPEVFVLLQKSLLEKLWKLPFTHSTTSADPEECICMPEVTRSGISARQRRTTHRRKCSYQKPDVILPNRTKQNHASVSPELVNTNTNGYVWSTVSESLLSHSEVVSLSKKIKAGLYLKEQWLKLKANLGFEPSDNQLASSLRISRTELRSMFFECALATEKLAMSNFRLVLSIAQKYDNLGAEMADLVQGGFVGLLRGVEKFDSSKGFKMSTYVYWWIRQGVSRALVENCRTLRLPKHLHARLHLISNAKIGLEEKGITPSVALLAKSLNMSQLKVRNAMEAVSKVFSLDREVFPSLNGLPGETLHNYIADGNLENNPWHGFEEWAVKDEVDKLLYRALSKRERDIIQLYHGLGSKCHTWEDIGKKFGLSRERVRQVGLVAMEKLKQAARQQRLEAMFAEQ